jgi:hypothetical protein
MKKTTTYLTTATAQPVAMWCIAIIGDAVAC